MARGPHLSELAAEWQALGAKPQHVRRIFLAWAGLAPWEARKGESFPKAVAEALPGIRERLDRLSHALPVRSAEAETVKLILGLEDGECVESVLLPRQGLCVSTQVGCAVGCVFCMTGKGGLVRQLSSAEIVAQYCEARRVRSDVRKIVLMGMGEPSHNLDAVCEAVEFFGNVCGLAHKDIVVSTVGDHRLFDRLPALSVRLADLIEGRYAMVNFIAVNPVEGSGFRRPESAHMQDLITILRRRGTVATLRDSAAQDIEGGCGQLRARVIGIRKEQA